MSKCYLCQADGLEFHETLRMNINPITGQKHGPQFCKAILKPNPIRITTTYGIIKGKKLKDGRKEPDKRIDLDFEVPIKEDQMAKAITDEAVRCGLDAYKVRVELRGQFIILH